MEDMKLEIENNMGKCEKSQKMLRLGTVFIDSIQWLQRGSQLEKSFEGNSIILVATKAHKSPDYWTFWHISDLKQTDCDWEMKNNLGVCNFHRLNILESVEQYESSLQSQILKTGVLSPQIIFPVQRNLFTLNEMYKK